MYTPEEIKEEGLDDFRVFLAAVWDYLGLPEPTPVQYEIAYFLQNGPDRAVLQAFRGVGKSWITVAFVLWVLFLDPQKNVLVVSAGSKLSKSWVKFAKDIISDMPLLQHLRPKRGQTDKAEIFDVGPRKAAKDSSVTSAGITSQITGARADIIVADDVEVPKNSFTHHLREKLSEQVKEFDAILKPGDESRIIFLGTPQVEDSLYPKLLGRGYQTTIWTAEVPEKPHVYKGNLGPRVQDMVNRGVPAGTPVDPDRFDKEDLYKRRLSYGSTGYALQFMLDTSPQSLEKHPLKLRDLIVMSLDKEMGHVRLAWGGEKDLVIEDLQAGGFDGDRYHRPAFKSDEMAPWQGTVMAIDPSGEGKDELAYAIVSYLHGQLYLRDLGGYQHGFAEETLEGLAASAARYDVNYVIAEENFGGGMFNQLLRPHLARYNGAAGTLDADWDGWARGMKERRILDVLEPLVGSHKLVVDRKVIERDLIKQEQESKFSFVQQYTRMERERGALPHEDRLEAVAIACSYWVDRMNRDAEKEQQRVKDQALEEELRSFMEHALGNRGSGKKRVGIRR